MCTDFCEIWTKYVGVKIKNGRKSILMEMGVAYIGRCVMTQGIQGKIFFYLTNYGSRVIELAKMYNRLL